MIKKPTPGGTPATDECSASLYVTELEIGNVRAFGSVQRLSLTDDGGRPAPWTLIIGENGTGKTTILQCVARMQPFPQWERGEDGEVKAGADSDSKNIPGFVEPDLLQDEGPAIDRLLRFSEAESTSVIRASWVPCHGLSTSARPPGKPIHIGVRFQSERGELKSYLPEQDSYTLPKLGPLVIGYGASRHVGHLNRTRVQFEESTSSLFKDAGDLYDADEILRDLHHAALDAKDKKKDAGDSEPTADEKRLDYVLAAVADLLPDKRPEDIQIRGPRVPGKGALEAGVHIRVSGNWTELSELSIGYQTVFAWTVDLAWRMIERYPKSDNPMHEPAVVLIDEVDLHLHPRWQRDLHSRLSSHFPNVQFIATTHSPFMAQEALTLKARLYLVHETEGDGGSEIVPDPIPPGDWRIDQVSTSRLFGYINARSKPVEEQLTRRTTLGRRARLTAEEKAELAKLDQKAARLPTAASPEDQKLRDDVRDVAQRVRRSLGLP